MRINLFAGPGAGKSTTASMQFARLKMQDYSVELVSEYVKAWAVAKRKVTGFDQVYLMGKQLQYEYRFVSAGVKNTITDSPVLLAACYTREFYPELIGVADNMEGIIAEYERQHPSINVFINRNEKKYHTEGRYQTEDEARGIDATVRETLDRLNIDYQSFDFRDQDGIFNYIQNRIDK
tara:strand:- start:198 stop:734 length:537 start_codon:yes stop_codon:yes gene_type:complete